MIVVTGAAGFIGSCLVSKLNQEGFKDIVAVDKFNVDEKEPNLQGKELLERVDRDVFMPWLDANANDVEFIFHLGARTDTTEFDMELLNRLNLDFSKDVWKRCVLHFSVLSFVFLC